MTSRWCVSALVGLMLGGGVQAETFRLGLGYDVAHDGHGFDLHKAGNTYILFFYTYDQNGDPEWFLGLADWDQGVIGGPLLRFTYDQTAQPAQTADPQFDGEFSLDRREAAVSGACNDGVDRGGASQLASFYWRTGAESGVWCTQFLFGAAPGSNPYYGGVWYAGEADAGYGFSMSQQDETVIGIVYYYDGDGQPRWALGADAANGVIDLDNYRGYCRTCDVVPRQRDPAGALSLDWDAGSNPGQGSDQASLALSYPRAPFGDFDREFTLVPLSDGAPTAQVTVGTMPGQAFFDTFVSEQLIQDRCITCHTIGGISANTRLVFQKTDQPNYRANNLAQIEALIDAEGVDYILNKVRGASAHGGGVQAPSDSPEYADLVLLFEVLDEGFGGLPELDLFAKVGQLSFEQTLRRAAVILAGRLPTEQEKAVARGGNEAQFRATIRGLMTGDGFHEFLIEGANDRLLTDKWIEDVFVNAQFEPYYPEYKRLVIENIELIESLPDGSLEQNTEFERIQGVLRRASAREPLELIAHVVENDRPYTEVVTADYTMVNPLLGEAYQSDTSFPDAQDRHDWRVGHNNGQLLIDHTYQQQGEQGFNRYLGGGIPLTMPHSGLLNTPAFLARYPSTATNRNRARARWTYYFFLGVDIEKLAARATDPDALADTNNPTLNNPNCTVCHQVHDPVAGAFQNYGDIGFYRDQFGGLDSLPDTYKFSEGSPYEEGDTWYRDMRDPGFSGQTAPNPDSSIQWLGQRIAEDPRFASGTVKFWWPAMFGRFPLEAPEAATDADFAAKLAAFETQNGYIESLADGFRSGFTSRGGYNLKDLLVEVVMGPWFRASGTTAALTPEEERALEAGFVGADKLLSPEQLERKVFDITGFVWHPFETLLGDPFTGLKNIYRLYYGGIDSDGINQRSTEITSVMSNVVAAFAAESACPIVIWDFDAPDEERKLFSGLSRLASPVFETAKEDTVSAASYAARTEHSQTVTLNPGAKKVRVDFLNDFFEETEGDRNLIALDIEVKRANGSTLASFDLEDLPEIPGATFNHFGTCNGVYFDEDQGPVGWSLSCQGFVEVPVNVTSPGDYSVIVTAFGQQAGPEDTRMLTTVVDTDPYGQSAGAVSLRERLVEWHDNFFGESVSVDSPEVARAYELLVETWQRNVDTDSYWWEQVCDFQGRELDEETLRRIDFDPQKMQATWRAMLTYFLTDYRFIFE